MFCDLRVLAAAPPRLIRAGLGDSACRSTAQADWLLSHALLDRPYRAAPFALLADDERALFELTDALVAGELGAMRYLMIWHPRVESDAAHTWLRETMRAVSCSLRS